MITDSGIQTRIFAPVWGLSNPYDCGVLASWGWYSHETSVKTGMTEAYIHMNMPEGATPKDAEQIWPVSFFETWVKGWKVSFGPGQSFRQLFLVLGGSYWHIWCAATKKWPSGKVNTKGAFPSSRSFLLVESITNWMQHIKTKLLVGLLLPLNWVGRWPIVGFLFSLVGWEICVRMGHLLAWPWLRPCSLPIFGALFGIWMCCTTILWWIYSRTIWGYDLMSHFP